MLTAAKKAVLLLGRPNWLPKAGGQVPNVYANFATQQYWTGSQQAGFSAWLSALGGTFTRASNGTFTNSAGLLATASSNVARFDYNPSTLAANGILLEGSRTNIALHSQAFNGAWGVTNITIADNSVTSPDGTVNGTLLTEAAGSGRHQISSQVTGAAGVTYSHSFFVKMGTRQFVWMNIAPAATEWISAVFDLGAGVVGEHSVGATGTFVSSSVQAFPNGWYRITLVGTTAATANPFFELGSANAASGNTFGSFGEISATTGSQTFDAWGAQSEIASFPSSYIATTTGSVTRAADDLHINPVGSWFNNPASTALAIGSVYGDVVGVQFLYRFANAGITDYMDFFINNNPDLNPRGEIGAGGVARIDHTFSAISLGSTFKTALSYQTADYAAVLNGGTPATTSSGSPPTTIDRLYFGESTVAAQQLFGTLSQFAYWPFRASNSDLQRLTQ